MIKYILHTIRYLKNKNHFDNIKKNLNEIEEFDCKSYEEKRCLQDKYIFRLLSHAVNECEYYKKFRNDSKHYDVFCLNALPILTKNIIRTNLDNIINNRWTKNAKKNTSGGTTGEPINIYQCENYSHWNHAYVEFMYQTHTREKKINLKIIKLWGSERDILSGNESLSIRMWHYLDNLKLLNAFKMNDNLMENYTEVIKDYNPHIIEAYAQSAYEFALFLKRKNYKISVPVILTSAGTLEPSMEEIIKDSFPESKIINRYGSRELGGIACSCDGSDFLHVSMLSHFVEVVDDDGNLLPDGEVGHILVTCLTNYVMPLIRYDIGDRGILRRGAVCPKCGWQGDILERITGRTVDVFKSKDGSLIDGEFFTHLFYFRNWVKKFQVIQQSLDNVDINIVLQSGYNDIPLDDQLEIDQAFRKVLPDTNINWNQVSDILSDKSGKIRFTISNVER